MKKVKGDWGMGVRVRCLRCGRYSYGFPLCSWCRRKANEGRIIGGRFVMWNRKAKVFELLTAEEVKEGKWK